jgi:hypothetical protein
MATQTTVTSQSNLKTRSGNRLVVQFGGLQIGLLQSVRASDDYGLEPASGIGDARVQEYVPGMARHTLSVQAMVLDKGEMLLAGIAPENSDGALQGLVFDIVVYDKDAGTALRKYTGCSYASGDIEVTKHAIVMQTAQLYALDVSGTAM